MLNDLVNSGGIDVLERTMQFARRRQELIAHNIANLSTPNYRPLDVDPSQFRSALADAVDKQRTTHPGRRGPIQPKDTRDIRFSPRGMELRPRPVGHGILFHDRNDRDLERSMQHLAENTLAYRTTAELLRSRFALLQMAIRERF